MEGVLTEAERDYYFLNWQLAIQLVNRAVSRPGPTEQRSDEQVQTRLRPGGTIPPDEKRAQ